MLRKHRYVILGGTLMILVVAACLFLPGFLLNLAGQQDVGPVRLADQEYNADNVSAGDSVDFNLQTRLLMLSGQWQCRDTVIREDEVYEGDRILSKDDMYFLGGNAFLFFIQILTESGVLDFPEFQEEGYGVLFDSPNTDCTYTLHRYEDQILGTYYFYIWEYSIKNDALGCEFNLMMDAVTLEVYSVRIQGSLFGNFSWNDFMRELSAALGNVEDDGSEESRWMHSYIDLPQDLVLFYCMNLWPAVLGQISYETEFFPLGIPYIGELPRTGERGYNFEEGNFFISRSVYFFSPDGIRDTLFADDFENQIYICMDEIAEHGFEWYLSASSDRII